jgi:hypothetical protein
MSNDETRDYGAATALIIEIYQRTIRIEQMVERLTKSADASTATPTSASESAAVKTPSAIPHVGTEDPAPEPDPDLESTPGVTFGSTPAEKSSD